jgi:hypothetical protein
MNLTKMLGSSTLASLILSANLACAQPPDYRHGGSSHGGGAVHSGASVVHSGGSVHSGNVSHNGTFHQLNQNHNYGYNNFYASQQPHQNHYYNNNNNGFYNGFYPSVVVYPDSVVTTYGPATVTAEPEPADENENGINQDTYVVVNPDTKSQSWVAAANGEVPNGAEPYTDDNQSQQSNNVAMFYCRGQYNNQSYSGVLVAGEGCYVDDHVNAATIRLQNYQVLVNN